MGDHILLVLSVAEGRRFPKRPHHQLVVEASFDAEILNTDLLKHVDTPRFNTELAWEIDKKSLHQHRLQRTPIKVQVYAVEAGSAKKDCVGYCILDLRTAHQDGKKKASWYSLLSSKYQNMKPEIQLSLSIEIDQVKEKEKHQQEQQKKGKTSSQQPKTDTSDEHDKFNVVLDNERGYYMIGPETDTCQVFVMSISVGGAKNLVELLPSDKNVNPDDGFYFYYSLFDNDVTNETFYDVMNPSMSTERATVRIYTTVKTLENYLRKKRSFEVYLCCSDNTLGCAKIGLEPLIRNSFSSPNTIEGLFKLCKSTKMDPSNYTDQDALVGVSIVLRKEDMAQTPHVSPVLGSHPKKVNHSASPKLSPEMKTSQSPVMKHTPSKSAERKPKLNSPGQAAPIYQTKTVEKNRHFVYSIDIRSILNMDLRYPVNCVCRYTYPFFGSSAPIITNPPVHIQRNSEVLLPHSFCKFEFASTFQLLHTTLSRVPLIVEIWNRDTNIKDELLGIAQIRLSEVFDSVKKRNDGPIVDSQRIDIVSATNPGYRIGTLHVVLGFEDRGEINKAIVARHEQSFSSNTVTEEASVEKNDAPRNTQEYQVAMALEMWRQQQEEHFKAQLSSKESERMKTLAEEWKQRDLEREMLLKRKLEEYSSLENRLKKTLVELEQRERQVTEKELKLDRSETLLVEEYERKTIEMREASRHVKEEYQHQLNLEKARYNDLNEKYRRSMEQLVLMEEKVKSREEEVYQLKESLLTRPDAKMQSDLTLLLLEKNELERKIESVTKSKIHYKQQWGRALRELARIKVNEQEAAKTRLKKQQQELDHMKLRYLAAEENDMMKNEKEELDNLKNEINQRIQELQVKVENPTKTVETQNDAMNDVSDDKEQQRQQMETFVGKSRIAKLIEERDTLLQTGVYTVEDRVIVEIEREIQQLISENR